jgi:hypothetical protein
MAEESGVESTNRLLRVVIALLLRQGLEPLSTLRQQIELLDGLGLGPTEISKIIGRSTTYVTKELAGIRKTRK